MTTSLGKYWENPARKTDENAGISGNWNRLDYKAKSLESQGLKALLRQNGGEVGIRGQRFS
jgi:hypothetical protein